MRRISRRDVCRRIWVCAFLSMVCWKSATLLTMKKVDIEARCAARGQNLSDVLERATETLSGLSSCAGLVLAPKTDLPIKQIEFVRLGQRQVLVVLVMADGLVENRVIEAPLGIDASTLTMASNYLNSRLVGRKLCDAQRAIETRSKRVALNSMNWRASLFQTVWLYGRARRLGRKRCLFGGKRVCWKM